MRKLSKKPKTSRTLENQEKPKHVNITGNNYIVKNANDAKKRKKKHKKHLKEPKRLKKTINARRAKIPNFVKN